MDWIFMILRSGSLVNVGIKFMFFSLQILVMCPKKIMNLFLQAVWMSSYKRQPLQTKQLLYFQIMNFTNINPVPSKLRQELYIICIFLIAKS